MSSRKRVFIPSYANPPGWVLEGELETLGISRPEFALRSGLSERDVGKVIAGEVPIDTETAGRIGRVLGGGSEIWLRMEANYRLRSAQLAEMETSPEYAAWLKRIPVDELAARDEIDGPESVGTTAAQVLAFFGVATLEEWRAKEATSRDARRFSRPFGGDESVLAAWLQFGEIEAVYADCPEYNEAMFREGLEQIRSLAAGGKGDIRQEAQRLCGRAGVVLVFSEPLAGLGVNGAAWWLSPDRAVIQLSDRHETDDLLWSTLFHEAAHILLHDKKDIFIDLPGKAAKEAAIPEDAEADAWVDDFLLAPHD